MNQLMYDLGNFFLPSYCPVCGDILYLRGEVICLKCELGMPRTNYSKDAENPVAEIFWGRVNVEGATSLFRFEKGSAYQPMLHYLKYQGVTPIGTYLGKLLGNDLKGTPFELCDIIVPVPLHRKRQRRRGYNQAEIIARGVSEVTGIDVNCEILFRKKKTATQTKKGKYERAVNMEGVFSLKEDIRIEPDLKVLLLDDVVTTGSTLEACAAELLKLSGLKLYIATVACA